MTEKKSTKGSNLINRKEKLEILIFYDEKIAPTFHIEWILFELWLLHNILAASNQQDNTTFAYEGSIYICVDQTRTYTTLLFTLQMHCPIIFVLNHLYLSAK